MPDYKTMYFELFNSITKATQILCDAQRKAEELYINSSEKTSRAIMICTPKVSPKI